jgi:CheY-like chemotaxis protein
MVYGVATNHGGTVLIESKVDIGTTVTVLLPAVRSKTNKEADEDVSKVPSTVPGRGGVLLVDDEVIIRSSIQRMLEKLGYWVFVAGNGREALEIFTEKKDEIDLVLLDIIMPVLDGFETLSELKKIDPEVKVVLTSGYVMDDKIDRPLEAEPHGFLPKPFDIEQLANELKRILKPSRL